MNRKECLEAMLAVWTEILENELTVKPDTEYIHDCPCCQYVVEQVHGENVAVDNSVIKFNMMSEMNNYNAGVWVSTRCEELCPLKTLWPDGCTDNDNIDEDNLEGATAFERWLYTSPCDLTAVNEIIDETKQLLEEEP